MQRRPPPRRHHRPSPRSGAGGTLFGIFIGIIVGLGLAAGVAFWLVRNNPAVQIPAITKDNAATATNSGKAAAASDKPRFDFYKILPGQEEPVTDRDLRAAAKTPDKAGAAKDVYFVQAGAFQNPADADNLKARLALIGLVSSVEPASLPDRGTWYRVRLGPYSQLEEINRVRSTLAQNGVEASLVRLKN